MFPSQERGQARRTWHLACFIVGEGPTFVILAGDVGGTHTRLAWCEVSGSRVTIEVVKIHASRDYRSLADIVSDFVSQHHRVADGAAFGVAGPVRDGRSKISNLSWEVDGDKLAGVLGLRQVVVANDLEVTAYGIASLEKDELVALNAGEPDPCGNEALIAAGTGLGEAGLHWEGDCHRPFASEGGHCDFASRNELETELLLPLARLGPRELRTRGIRSRALQHLPLSPGQRAGRRAGASTTEGRVSVFHSSQRTTGPGPL